MTNITVSNYDLVIRLCIACLCGGLIGWERERLDRPAGFRTHILVCVGSTLIMLVSMYGFKDFPPPHDPARLSAQVVSGIGFLGAGTILREGFSVKGLTTAASLWVVSGIGLGIGSGFYLASIVCTFIIFLTLRGSIEHLLFENKEIIKCVMDNKPGKIGCIATKLGQYSISIKEISIHNSSDNKKIEVEFSLRIPPKNDLIVVIDDLNNLEGIYSIEKVH